jgi:hypothetical protein
MSSGSLSESWLGARTGLDPARLDVLRRRGELLGVRVGSQYEYPAWQFGPDGQPLPALAAVLSASRSAGVSDERVVQLLNAPAGLGSDRRLGDALRDGNVEHVVSVILSAR